MESKAVSDSLKIAWKVTRSGARITATAATRVARGADRAYRARRAQRAGTGTRAEPVRAEPAPTGVTPGESTAAPVTREMPAPEAVDAVDALVGERAGAGATAGTAAELELSEPFPGYGTANVEAVKARIAEADADQLALIERYEQAHKNRKGVLEAAAKRLRTLPAPS